MAETITLKTIREEAAGDLALLIDTTIDAVVDPTNYTINQILDKAPDVQRLQDSFLYQGGDWRRIVTVLGANVEVSRTSTFTATVCQIYSFLDPDEMNDAINDALQELYYEEIETISLVADTYIYTLPTWLQTRGQFISVKWRDVENVSTNPREEHVNSYALIEDANVLKIRIHDLLRDITLWDLQVSGRRNYSALASDAATTTCPRPLILEAAKVNMLHKIHQKYGKGINSLFGQKTILAERSLATAKNDWLPKLKAREFIEEEDWQGPDTNEYFDSPTW